MSSPSYLTPLPQKYSTPIRRSEHLKKFIRKPDGRSDRSSSRKSQDNKTLADMYVKSPGSSSSKRPRTNNQDFFATLASTIIKTHHAKDKKLQGFQKYQSEKTDRTDLTEMEDLKDNKVKIYQQNQTNVQKLTNRVRALQASLDLKNHQTSVLSSQCQRLKKTLDQEKQQKKKNQSDKKQIFKQFKRQQKQKQHLTKQIQFLQRINYDDKTRQLQSYRQSYLEKQMQKMRKQFQKSRQQRQQQLQNQIKTLRQQKFAAQSHLKAIKVANQCLVKQINNFQQGLQDIIINSQVYRKLRDKYIRFLQQYKLLRNQYWAFKAQSYQKPTTNDDSQFFEITTSSVDNDLSQLRSSNSNQNIHQPQPSINSYSSTRVK